MDIVGLDQAASRQGNRQTRHQSPESHINLARWTLATQVLSLRRIVYDEECDYWLVAVGVAPR